MKITKKNKDFKIIPIQLSNYATFFLCLVLNIYNKTVNLLFSTSQNKCIFVKKEQ